MNSEGPVRKNGLEPPYEPLQVMTWILLVVMIGGFYGLVLPPLPLYLQVTMGFLFGILVVISIIAAFIACAIDPSDDNVLGITPVGGNTPPGTDNIYCRLCTTHVNRSSKHCRYCEKCVDNFDHHCKWLNNCIGKKNYRYFLILLVGTFFFTLLELAMFIHNAVLYLQNQDEYEKRVADSYPSDANPVAFFIVSWAFVAMLFPVAGLLGQLFYFHITLLREGMTTYDYIIREQQKDRAEEAARAQAMRDGHGSKGFSFAGVCCGGDQQPQQSGEVPYKKPAIGGGALDNEKQQAQAEEAARTQAMRDGQGSKTV